MKKDFFEIFVFLCKMKCLPNSSISTFHILIKKKRKPTVSKIAIIIYDFAKKDPPGWRNQRDSTKTQTDHTTADFLFLSYIILDNFFLQKRQEKEENWSKSSFYINHYKFYSGFFMYFLQNYFFWNKICYLYFF